jgi:hypothetical protein
MIGRSSKMKKIELKSIKHCEWASQETNNYVANIWVDGKKFAHVKNDGHGGCDLVIPYKPFTHEDVNELNQWCKDNLPKHTSNGVTRDDGSHYEFETDLEWHCADLLSDWLIRKDYKRLTRTKILYYEEGVEGVYEMGFKNIRKLTEPHFLHVKTHYPDRIVLNTMPEDQAIAIFKGAVK